MEKLHPDPDSDEIVAPDAIAAILKAGSIVLPGRTPPSMAQKLMTPFQVKATPIPSSPVEAMAQMLPAKKKKISLADVGMWGGCAFMAASIGYFAAIFQENPTTPKTISPRWQVTTITESGVEISTAGGKVNIKIGEAMPNGSTLKSVSPTQHSFVTDAGAFILSSK